MEDVKQEAAYFADKKGAKIEIRTVLKELSNSDDDERVLSMMPTTSFKSINFPSR